MITSIAQQLALISFGNNFLRTGLISDTFYPNNTTFQFCQSVQFFELKKFLLFKPTAQLMAVDPIQWLKRLKDEGCIKIRMRYKHSEDQSFAKDHKMAGMVGGGGVWMLENVFNSFSHFWVNDWQVKDINAPNKKIWSVNYVMVSKYQDSNYYESDVRQAKDELTSALTNIKNFAQRNDLATWVGVFENSLQILNSDSPYEQYYHQDLIDIKSHDLLAQQVLFACGTAFVFGGMGSWNDIGFESQEIQDEYEALSEQLYEAIVKGIEVAINAPSIG